MSTVKTEAAFLPAPPAAEMLPVALYASLLELCSSRRDLPALLRAHARVIAAGDASHDFIRTKLVAAYARCGRIADAFHIFHRANRRPTFLFNSLLAALSSVGLHRRCLRFFLLMRRFGKPPDRCTFPSLLSSCAALSALHIGRQVHAAVLVNGFASDLANSNAVLDMYSKCGCVDVARVLFDAISEPNVVSWSAMIGAYGGHGRSEEAVALFEQMVGEAGISPDAVTFTAVLAACSHGGNVELGKKVFGMMEGKFGIRPRLEHYTCMVDLLGRAGEVDEAERLLLGMKLVPDAAFWGALLGACRIHGKVDLAERVAKRLCE